MERRATAILFVDVCASTDYFERHGEILGREMVLRCLQLAAREIEARGRVVRFLGDALLAAFDTADLLVEAASAAHSAVEVWRAAGEPGERMRVHSGGHVGVAVFDDEGDVFGDVANVAARIDDLAGAGQVYVSRELVESLSASGGIRTRRVGVFPVQGKAEEIEIHEVLWKAGELTAAVAHETPAEETWLELTFQDQQIRLTSAKKRVSIGRIAGNDVVVRDRAVSREHAEVVHRKGRCYLMDRSTNGTYLKPGRRRPRFLHREELLLEGEGQFSLGRADGPAVAYRIIDGERGARRR